MFLKCEIYIREFVISTKYNYMTNSCFLKTIVCYFNIKNHIFILKLKKPILKLSHR